MMKKTIPLFITGIFSFLVLLGTLRGQTVTLSFTGMDAANRYVQLDSIVVTNQTKGWQEILIWPDTVLTIQNEIGIHDVETMCTSSLQLFQNNPNPFNGTTNVSLALSDEGPVYLEINDMSGRVIIGPMCATSLQRGTHQFHISLSSIGTYVMTARQNGKTSYIKMICNGIGDGNKIDYAGIIETPFYNPTTTVSAEPKSHTRGLVTHPFDWTDIMEYRGFATIDSIEVESPRIEKKNLSSENLTLWFAIACPGTPTLTDVDGNIYKTVLIGNQCWMRENLRTTRYADSTDIIQGGNPASPGSNPYWFCPNNDNVSTYGLLYNWPAVMHGAASSDSIPSGIQGVCPDGWHVPSDAEWFELTNYVRSQSRYLCEGTYITKALADTMGWHSGAYECSIGYNLLTNNATGFSALPAGEYIGYPYGDIYDFRNISAFFWSSTLYFNGLPKGRRMNCDTLDVNVTTTNQSYGYSVRCLRD